MSVHLSARDIKDYVDLKLLPTRLLSVDSHVASCLDCRTRLRKAVGIEPRLVSAGQETTASSTQLPSHLSYQELERYVDGLTQVSESPRITEHLEHCSLCRSEIEGLQELRQRLSQSKPSQPKRTLQQWLPRAYSHPGRIAVAAFLLAVFGLSLLWLARGGYLRTPLNHSQVESALQQPGSLPTQRPGRGATLPDPPPAGVLVSLHDQGNTVTLTSSENLRGLDSAPQEWQDWIVEVLNTGKIAKPAALFQVLGSTAATGLRGAEGPTRFRVLGPIGEIVAQQRPTFRWQSLQGAAGYRVTITDTRFNVLESSPLLQELEWTPRRDLPRGVGLIWQVAALRRGRRIVAPRPPEPAAQFAVLARSDWERLKEAEQQSLKSHLLMGVLYAKAGLRTESEQAFQALLEANPDSTLVKGILESLQDWRPGQ